MKLIITLAVAALLVSCSSKQKQGDTVTTATKSTSKAAASAKTAASKKESANGEKVTCTKGKEERTLEVATEGNGCKLNYTKSGATSSPATSAHGTAYCQKVADKIKGNLTTAGYTCN